MRILKIRKVGVDRQWLELEFFLLGFRIAQYISELRDIFELWKNIMKALDFIIKHVRHHLLIFETSKNSAAACFFVMSNAMPSYHSGKSLLVKDHRVRAGPI